MVESTTTMIVLGTDSTTVFHMYSPKLPTVQARVTLSVEKEVNRPNGFVRTSVRALNAVEIVRMTGNSISSDSAMSRACLPATNERFPIGDGRLTRPSDTGRGAAAVGSTRSRTGWRE